MNWLKWINHIKKFQANLKENREHIKSAVLTLMIVLSLVLTWSLWTFKPSYSMLEGTRTVKKQVVEDQLSLSNVVTPTQVIFHKRNQLLGVEASPVMDLVHEEISNAKFNFESSISIKSQPFSPEDNPVAGYAKNGEYIEVIYPAAMNPDVYQDAFPFDMDVPSAKPQKVDRIFLYQSNNGVEGMLVSYQQRRMHRIRVTNLSYNNLENNLEKARGEGGVVPYMSYDIKEPVKQGMEQIAKRFYFPKNETMLNRNIFIASATTEDTYEKYKQALFPDPLAVKSSGTSNNEITYTDGNAAMVIDEILNRFKYTNFAGQGNANQPQTSSPLFLSMDYINTHAGWGNPYILSNLTNYTAEFWMYVENLPILDDDMQMRVEWTQNELYEYERSLINLNLNSNKYPDNITAKVPLYSGEDVKDEIEREDYTLSNIKDIRIGYTIKRQNDPHTYILEPRWFINYDNKGWQLLFREDREGGY